MGMMVLICHPRCQIDMRRPTDSNENDVVDGAMAEVPRKKSPAERIQMLGDFNRTARILAAAGIRYQHPDWDDTHIQAEVLKRICGRTA